MNWTWLTNALVPLVSVISTATVAIWIKRIDARTKREDRRHELILDYERRAGDDKKAVLKSLISATLHVKRGTLPPDGGRTEANADVRRGETIRQLYEFRARLGLDDGVAELMAYAGEPVRELTDLLLDEWDRQFREHGYTLSQLDTCKQQLLTPADSGQQQWNDLKTEEASWLAKLGAESDLDVDALADLCERTLKAAHLDLRGGHGFAT